MGILDGKRILVAGVTMDSLHRLRHGQGGAGAGRHRAHLQLRPRAGHHQADRQAAAAAEPPVLELDVTDEDHLAGLADQVREHVDGLDGVVHSIAYGNPETLLGGKFLDGPWDDVAQAVQVSAYSLKSLAIASPPLMSRGRLDRRADLRRDGRPGRRTTGWASPRRRWSRTSRYLARDLGPEGIRCNLVSAGPLKTLAAKAIPGFEDLESAWKDRAPLGWDETDHEPTAQAVVRPAERLLPGHHRRDRARRRRLPRDGCCDRRRGLR